MNILIVGGTSGIGLALAQYYLAQGDSVTICGRDLSKVPASIHHDRLSMITVNVCQKQSITTLFTACSGQTIDLFIYCAGKYFNERRLSLTENEQAEMIAVNEKGFTDCFTLAAAQMKQQQHGHLVTISSVAGLINASKRSLYSQLKSEMISKATKFASQLSAYNVAVTVIAPGYINTQKLRDLNNGDASSKPFLLEEHQAVEHITKAIKNQNSLAIFPLQMRMVVCFLNLLPANWVTCLLNRRG